MFTDTVYCVNWPFLCYRDDNTRVVKCASACGKVAVLIKFVQFVFCLDSS